jgi:small subunit ribosomal protein S17
MADEETPIEDEGVAAADPVGETAAAPVTDEAPAAEPEAPDADDQPAGESTAADLSAGESATSEPPAEETAAQPPAATPAEPLEVLSSKERRRRTRQRASSGAGAPRTPEERQAERDATRAKAAKARSLRRRKERERKPAAAAATAAVETAPSERGRQKVRQGVVTSDKGEKTITVRIDVSRRHRRYGKVVRTSKSLHAHDENNDAHEGDLVRIIETRPLSRTKRWRLEEIVERAR